MTILDRLDLVISLLDAGKPYSEIKGNLILMREEIEAYSQGSEELSKLKAAHSALQEEHAGLKPPPGDEPMCGSEPQR